MKRILSFLILSFLFIKITSAREYRSNHSYQALGFTRLPQFSFGATINAMVVKPIIKSDDNIYSGYQLKGVYDGINKNDLTLNNRFFEDNLLYFALDSNIKFTISAVNDFGFIYGAIVDLNANTTPSSQNKSINANADSAYIYSEFVYGKIEFGSVDGASSKLKIDAGNLLRNKRDGINGRYLDFVNLPSIGDVSPLYILTPQHPTGHGGFGIGFNNLLFQCDINGNKQIDDPDEMNCYNENATNINNNNYIINTRGMENSLKISYYTPEISGFIAGISFTPDTGNRGAASWNNTSLKSGDIDNVFEYGLNYSNTFYGAGIIVGFTGQIGKNESRKEDAENTNYFREDLNSIQYGIILSYYGLSFSASKGDWDRSLQYKDESEDEKNKNKGDYITAGISYEFGPLLISGTYFKSTFQKNNYNAISLNIDYKLSKSFLPYIEYTQYSFKANDDTIKINQGNVITGGFILFF
jgi:hypothetical protein